MSIPVLDLNLAESEERGLLLSQLRDALFNVGFLYIKNHGVAQSTITGLTGLLPRLFDLPLESKARLSKLNSPHFLGYSGFAEEKTLGKRDLREQFDYATELPIVWQEHGQEEGPPPNGQPHGRRDFTKLYWRLRGPNQWPSEDQLPGFREAFLKYVFPLER
jgi:isopenicillin N synthase-like dioxygenase